MCVGSTLRKASIGCNCKPAHCKLSRPRSRNGVKSILTGVAHRRSSIHEQARQRAAHATHVRRRVRVCVVCECMCGSQRGEKDRLRCGQGVCQGAAGAFITRALQT
eukprot:4966912-Pleurochrysis_carterae.AAC.2